MWGGVATQARGLLRADQALGWSLPVGPAWVSVTFPRLWLAVRLCGMLGGMCLRCHGQGEF